MNKKENRFFHLPIVFLLVSAFLAAFLFCAGASAEAGGTGSDGLVWTLDDDGLLTVSGSGPMFDHPWTAPQLRNTIKNVVIEDGVTSIAVNAFSLCSNIRTVSLPDSVKKIGDNAFNLCSIMTDITVPHDLTEIGIAAFNNCWGLTSFSFPATLEKIGRGAFTGCRSLTEFSVDPANSVYCAVDGVVYSKDMTRLIAYPGNSLIAHYQMPDTVTTLNESVFFSCVGLQEVTVSERVTVIPLAAFREANDLLTVHIPDSVTSIGANAFRYCARLQRIEISRYVTTINSCAFSGCSRLTAITVDSENPNYCSVNGILFSKDKKTLFCYPGGKSGSEYTVPDHVKIVEDGAFSFCINLDRLTIPSGVTRIGGSAFSYTSGLTQITVPASVTDLGASAFMYCTGLINVRIEAGISVIGNSVFLGCRSLQSVTIPHSVTTVQSDAFASCDALTTVYYKGSESDRVGIAVESGNAALTNATWVYQPVELIDLSGAVISPIKDQTYTGKAIKPAVTVTLEGATLAKGTDYTLSYKKNKAVGKAKVTVTGIGSYTGTKTVSFLINPKPVKLSSLKAGSGKLTIKWKKGSGIDGYEIEYSLKKNFKSAKKITVSKASTTKYVLSGLKAKKTCYIRIRTWKKSGGKKYCSEWSAVKNKTVR